MQQHKTLLSVARSPATPSHICQKYFHSKAGLLEAHDQKASAALD